MSAAASAIHSPSEPPSTPWDPGLYRLTVEQYERMGTANILTEDDRVELVGGFLVRKLTKHEPHSFACTAAREALAGLLPAGWYLRVEQPVRIPDRDEPEPDLAIVKGTWRDHLRLGRPPEPGEVALVVEVSDATLARDRSGKLRAYARGRIPTYWIVNLPDRQVEVYTEPDGVGYGVARVLRPGELLPFVLDDATLGQVAVADLLP